VGAPLFFEKNNGCSSELPPRNRYSLHGVLSGQRKISQELFRPHTLVLTAFLFCADCGRFVCSKLAALGKI